MRYEPELAMQFHPSMSLKVGSAGSEPNNTGQSTFRNFLHAVGLISDCGDAPLSRCWRHDPRPLHPRSARFSRHLSLRVALCAARRQTPDSQELHRGVIRGLQAGLFEVRDGNAKLPVAMA